MLKIEITYIRCIFFINKMYILYLSLSEGTRIRETTPFSFFLLPSPANYDTLLAGLRKKEDLSLWVQRTPGRIGFLKDPKDPQERVKDASFLCRVPSGPVGSRIY